MICACVPESVRVELPFAPALIVAPPARLTVTAPLVTVRRVVERLPSTSLTLTPPIESAVSSFTACAPGTALTGASFAPLIVKETFRVVPSALVTVNVSIAVWPAPRLCTAAFDTV